jgi:hypothetical protein
MEKDLSKIVKEASKDFKNKIYIPPPVMMDDAIFALLEDYKNESKSSLEVLKELRILFGDFYKGLLITDNPNKYINDRFLLKNTKKLFKK